MTVSELRMLLANKPGYLTVCVRVPSKPGVLMMPVEWAHWSFGDGADMVDGEWKKPFVGEISDVCEEGIFCLQRLQPELPEMGIN